MPHSAQLKKSSSLSEKLPVRRLSLREDDEPGPLADNLWPPKRPSLVLSDSHLTPKRSRRETQESDAPSQRQVTSTLLECDFPQADESCPMISPTRSIRFGSSQGFPYSQPSVLSQFSPTRRLLPSNENLPSTPPKAAPAVDESQTQELTPASVHHATPSKAAAPMDDSQTQEMTPVSMHYCSRRIPSQSLPLEVKEFHAMFEGGREDESYPPDFPMSLRIVGVNSTCYARFHSPDLSDP